MARIICGLFDDTMHADAALEDLKREGFQRSEVDAFYVPPPGQHAMTRSGDSPHASEGRAPPGIGAGSRRGDRRLVGGGAWVAASAGDIGLRVSRLAWPRAYLDSFAAPCRACGGKRSSASVEHSGRDARRPNDR
jgi:hypothetical protein